MATRPGADSPTTDQAGAMTVRQAMTGRAPAQAPLTPRPLGPAVGSDPERHMAVGPGTGTPATAHDDTTTPRRGAGRHAPARCQGRRRHDAAAHISGGDPTSPAPAVGLEAGTTTCTAHGQTPVPGAVPTAGAENATATRPGPGLPTTDHAEATTIRKAEGAKHKDRNTAGRTSAQAPSAPRPLGPTFGPHVESDMAVGPGAGTTATAHDDTMTPRRGAGRHAPTRRQVRRRHEAVTHGSCRTSTSSSSQSSWDALPRRGLQRRRTRDMGSVCSSPSPPAGENETPECSRGRGTLSVGGLPWSQAPDCSRGHLPNSSRRNVKGG